MTKKLILLVATTAIIGLAVPALANAATGFTEEGKPGTLLPKGTKVTLTSIGLWKLTSSKLGIISCEKVTHNGEVTKDSESEGVEGVGVGEGTASGCKNGSSSFTVTKLKVVNLKSTAAETEMGTASLSFTTQFAELTCNYTVTNGTITYVTNTDRIKFEKVPVTVTPAACGSTTLDAEFTLETTASPNTPILIM